MNTDRINEIGIRISMFIVFAMVIVVGVFSITGFDVRPIIHEVMSQRGVNTLSWVTGMIGMTSMALAAGTLLWMTISLLAGDKVKKDIKFLLICAAVATISIFIQTNC